MCNLHSHTVPVAKPTAIHPTALTLLALAFLVCSSCQPAGHWSGFAGLWAALLLTRLSRPRALLAWQLQSLSVLPFTLAALPLLFQHHPDRYFTIVLKAMLGLQASLALIQALGAPVLLASLRSLGAPRLLLQVAALMLRYVDVLRSELQRMQRARQSRSGAGSPPWHWRARVLGQIAGSLFLRSLDRSERVHQAMLSRGYDGGERRSAPRPWRFPDSVALLGGLAYLVLCLCWM